MLRNIRNDKIENKLCNKCKKTAINYTAAIYFCLRKQTCRVAFLCKVDNWEPSESSFLVFDGYTLSVEVMLGPCSNV